MPDPIAPGAAPAAPTPSPAPWGFVSAQDGTYAPNWADGLPDELRPAAPSVAMYKSQGELIKAHWQLKQRLGKAATAAFVPEDFAKASPEELAGFHKAINAPDSPDGYGLEKAPQGIPADRWTPEIGKEVSELLHKHHAPHGLAQDLMALEARRISEGAAAQEAAEKAYKTGLETKLKEVFGAEYEPKMKAAYSAAGGLGVDLANLDEVALVQAFAKLSTLTAEDERVRKSLGLQSASLSAIGENPGSRATDIMTNPKNPLYGRYHNEDPEVRGIVRDLLKQSQR